MPRGTEQLSPVQLAHRLYERFNERDLDSFREVAAPDIEWDWSRSIGPDEGVLHGPAAVTRFIRAQWEHWDSIEMSVERVVDAGDQVLVGVLVRLRGRDGIEVEARGPHLQTWRGGRLIRYELFQEWDEALEAIE